MLTVTELQSGPIQVVDYRCSAGPDAKPFTELHQGYSVSYVRKGSFGYRVRGASYELVAGSVLVGHPGDEFMCTHDHHAVKAFYQAGRQAGASDNGGPGPRTDYSPTYYAAFLTRSRASCRWVLTTRHADH